MLLILACDEDRLAADVHSRVITSGSPVLQLSESKLFADVPFSLEINRTGRGAFLLWDARPVPLHEITSVFFRLPRLWWPSFEFDMQDQLFVYHETASSWFSLLSGLSCVQINRFGLGWWVHDLCYLDQLRFGIAQRLGLVAKEAPTAEHPVRLLPTPVRESEDTRHAYVIGESIVPRNAKDHAIVSRLENQKLALAHWQQETGITFCRLDFIDAHAIELAYVEPMPILDDERPDLVSEIGEQLARRLS